MAYHYLKSMKDEENYKAVIMSLKKRKDEKGKKYKKTEKKNIKDKNLKERVPQT